MSIIMMMEIFSLDFIHPSAFYLIGGLLIPVLKGRVRQGYMLLMALLAFLPFYLCHMALMAFMSSSVGN